MTMTYMFQHPQTNERSYHWRFAEARDQARAASREHADVHIDIYRKTESGNYSPFVEVWGSQKAGQPQAGD